MELTYNYAESTVKPEALEIAVNTVYLRKDITLVSRSDGQGNAFSYWAYLESKTTLGEFNKYANLMLISAQKNGDDNQLIIMDAIADLYETIAMMTM